MITSFDKAIAPIVGALLTLFVMLGLLPAEWQGPEIVTSVTAVVSAILVWLVPNKHGGGGGP